MCQISRRFARLRAGFFHKFAAMAPALTLYSNPGNKNTNKSLIAAQYAGVSIDVPAGFEFGKTNKTPEFLKLNPHGKVGRRLAASERNAI